MSDPVPTSFYHGHPAMGCDMSQNHRVPAAGIVLGLSLGLVLICDSAFGGEGAKTRIIVTRDAQTCGSLVLLPVFLDGERLGDISSGGTLDVWRAVPAGRTHTLRVGPTQNVSSSAETRFVANSPTVEFRVWVDVGWWVGTVKVEAVSGTIPPGSVNVQDVILGEKTIQRKVASEEYQAVDGFAVQVSRSSTWERGVSLSRISESLIRGGITVGVLEASIEGSVADMFASEIRQSTTAGSTATIDGDVWKTLRVDWYAIVRPGKAFLEVDGLRREVAFEYIVGYKPVPVGGKRRNQSAGGAIDEDDPFGADYSDETTPLGTEQPRGRNPLISTSYR